MTMSRVEVDESASTVEVVVVVVVAASDGDERKTTQRADVQDTNRENPVWQPLNSRRTIRSQDSSKRMKN